MYGQVHNERLTRGLISNYLQSDWMLVNDTRSPEEVGEAVCRSFSGFVNAVSSCSTELLLFDFMPQCCLGQS